MIGLSGYGIFSVPTSRKDLTTRRLVRIIPRAMRMRGLAYLLFWLVIGQGIRLEFPHWYVLLDLDSGLTPMLSIKIASTDC